MKPQALLVALIVMILAAFGARSLSRGLRFKKLASCFNNLRQISSAKGSVGLENRFAVGTLVSFEQIAPYLRDGGKGTRCPADGSYETGLYTGGKDPGNAQQMTRCSVHGSLGELEDALKSKVFPNGRIEFAICMACFAGAVLVALGYLVLRCKRRLKSAAGSLG